MVFTLGPFGHTFDVVPASLLLYNQFQFNPPSLRSRRCRKNLPLCAAVIRLREPLIGQRVVSSMANYLVHHTKKKQILARKEATLQRLIDAEAVADKLIAAAEEVRDARIRVLRVQRSIIVPKGDADAQYAKIDAKIETLSNTSAATILAGFGCAVDTDGDFDGGASGT